MNNYKLILLIWNIVVMVVYGIDKSFAKNKKRRISEKTLLLLSFLFGGIGAMFGMVLFNHKTSKLKFRILVPLAVVIQVAVIILL